MLKRINTYEYRGCAITLKLDNSRWHLIIKTPSATTVESLNTFQDEIDAIEYAKLMINSCYTKKAYAEKTKLSNRYGIMMNKEDSMERTLNNNLKAILADQGISMRSLAGKTGLTVCQISRMAAGKSAQLIPWCLVLNALDVGWDVMFPEFFAGRETLLEDCERIRKEAARNAEKI